MKAGADGNYDIQWHKVFDQLANTIPYYFHVFDYDTDDIFINVHSTVAAVPYHF